jgi:hypothetical protein
VQEGALAIGCGFVKEAAMLQKRPVALIAEASM